MDDLHWFSDSPARREASRQTYEAWRLKVPARHRPAATAKLLYLYMLTPAMAQAKATLEADGLWAALTPEPGERRAASPAWKRFNELPSKAVAIADGFDAYRRYSLTRDIGELSAQVVAAEARLRQDG